MRNRRAGKFQVSPTEFTQLNAILKAASLDERVLMRVEIIRMSAEGHTVMQIASRLHCSPQTICLWRKRYLKLRFQGLQDSLREGRPPGISAEQELLVVRKLIESTSEGEKPGSLRRVAKTTGMSYQTVRRIQLRNHIPRVQHRRSNFIPDAPALVDVCDIVGVFLGPHDHVIALCVREGFHQATGDHNIPLLLSGLRFLEGPTRDFGRHGELTLCTALDVGLKRTITSIRRHQRHMELQSFVDQLSQNVPQEFNVHLLVDDESSYKNQTIRRWIVNQPRFHFHHTSSYTFWLTQFRTMVNLVAQQAIRPGTFKIVAEISSKVDRYVELCKKHRCAFAWTASQESIVAKLKRRDDFIYNHHTD